MTNLTRIIRKAIKESVLLTEERVICPYLVMLGVVACTKTCGDTTLFLSQEEADGCSFGQSNDSCCGEGKITPTTDGKNTIRRSDRDKARRRPYSAKSNSIKLQESKLINLINRVVNESEVELNEKAEGCYVMCDWAPSGGKQKEWCKNCKNDKKKDKCCEKSIWNNKSVNTNNQVTNSSIRVTESGLINLIQRAINEQGSNNTCSNNSMWCHQNLTNATPNPSWITQMETLAASPGGCSKIVQKESQIDSKFNSKVGTTGCTGPKGEGVHRVCNGSNPKWVAKLKWKLDWLAQSSSPFMLCSTGTCNDNTNDCE